MEAVRSSEMLVSFFKVTRFYYPEGQSRHLHRRDNLKSQTPKVLALSVWDIQMVVKWPITETET
jgi:hypothetical protein